MKTVIMKALKYDQKPHYEQELDFVHREEGYIVLKGRKQRKLIHHSRKKEFTFNNVTYEYFFEDRWYTAALVLNEQNQAEYIYCNIALPAKITEATVEFIDLDVDVIMENQEIKVVDIDEFEENQIRYSYGDETIRKVLKTAQDLKEDIRYKRFPFDGHYMNFISR